MDMSEVKGADRAPGSSKKGDKGKQPLEACVVIMDDVQI